MSHAFIGVRLV